MRVEKILCGGNFAVRLSSSAILSKKPLRLATFSVISLLASCGLGSDTQPMSDPTQGGSHHSSETRQISNDRDDPADEAMPRSEKIQMDNQSKHLSMAELGRILQGARFRPRQENSLASTLIFQDPNMVIYSRYSAGPIYSQRYYEIKDQKICVYDDKDLSIHFECISFNLIGEDLFQLDFKGKIRDNIGVLYVRESIGVEGER